MAEPGKDSAAPEVPGENMGIGQLRIKRPMSERTAADKVISFLKAAQYALTEPALLRAARLLYEKDYSPDDSRPLISVYVPTYNRAEMLMERSVKSVLGQTYGNFELIIIGDHCTDRTEEYVTAIKDERVRFYNIPKRGYRYPETSENHWLAGPVVAANTALGMIRGKWIARIDDDDIWTPDHIESLLELALGGNHEFVSGCCIAERFGKRYLDDAKNETHRVGATQTWLYRSYLKFFRYNIHCWRKSWNRVNDTDILDRMVKAGVRMGFLEKVVGYTLPRPGEQTIGLDAYIVDEEEKLKQYKFDG